MTDLPLTLVTGTKQFSSWSMRPWLVLKHLGLPFVEIGVTLRQPDTKTQILRHSPSGKVPVLKHGALLVWDTLAICEYLAELAPDSGLWPADRAVRAVARAVSAEMHAGFQPLRQHMPMDVRLSQPDVQVPAEVEGDIARIVAVWTDCRRRFGQDGPFLFGRFGIADAMYAPVVTRFATYGVKLEGEAGAYAEAVMALPALREWVAAAGG